jgi:AraC-like DNA-binding protein
MNEIMDALSEALRSLRITGALFLDAQLGAPWGFSTPHVRTAMGSLAPPAEHLVLFHFVHEGRATACVASQPPLLLQAGDIVLLPHGDAHELYNGPVAHLVDTTAQLPKLLRGSIEVERGGGGGEPTKFICGYFGCERYAERLFLAGLPPLFKVNLRGDAPGVWIERTLRLLVEETAAVRAGSLALIAKLCEALFIQTLRAYMQELTAEQTGWLAAARDAVVGSALAHLHRDPARAWTLPDLARAAGTSRTVLAEHFTRFVGQPPLAYLATWRLQLAARLLETTDDTALQIAVSVGYESEAAFNRAFKRIFGLPPGKYRREQRLRASRVTETKPRRPKPRAQHEPALSPPLRQRERAAS